MIKSKFPDGVRTWTYDKNDVRFGRRTSARVTPHDDPADEKSEIASVGRETISGVNFGSEPIRASVLDFEGRERRPAVIALERRCHRSGCVYVANLPT